MKIHYLKLGMGCPCAWQRSENVVLVATIAPSNFAFDWTLGAVLLTGSKMNDMELMKCRLAISLQITKLYYEDKNIFDKD